MGILPDKVALTPTADRGWAVRLQPGWHYPRRPMSQPLQPVDPSSIPGSAGASSRSRPRSCPGTSEVSDCDAVVGEVVFAPRADATEELDGYMAFATSLDAGRSARFLVWEAAEFPAPPLAQVPIPTGSPTVCTATGSLLAEPAPTSSRRRPLGLKSQSATRYLGALLRLFTALSVESVQSSHDKPTYQAQSC
jgi:hypothetical protein